MTIRFYVVFAAATLALAGAPIWAEANPEGGSDPGAAALEKVPPAEQTSASEEIAAPARGAGTIARSTFTTAVVDREPQDSIRELTGQSHEIYYFTDLRGFEGTTVTHRWEHDGQTVAEVFFKVRGPRWRVYSSKRLPENPQGEWAVSVVDDMNQVLRTESLQVAKAGTSAPAAALEAPAAGTTPAAMEPSVPERVPPAAMGD